jgi:poly(hydroxyalkanoate) depolymerase family esterase
MIGKLWARAKEFVVGLFRRKPPEPGRFESGSRWSFTGWIGVAPWIWPRREYVVYVPRGHSSLRRSPLLVLIHGCRQTPEDIAAGTRIAELADERRCLVLLPRQNPNANSWGCWNWFDRATGAGRGETAIVAAQIRTVRRRYWVDRKRVVVAGMSSGGALAAALGLRKPGLVSAIVVHSGLACGAAASPFTALRVLTDGSDADTRGIGHEARAEAHVHALPVPLLAIHGGSDDVVKPIHAAQLVRQYLAFNAHPAAAQGSERELPPPDRSASATTADARTVTTSEWRVNGRLIARHVLIDRLAHAWSGGDDHLPYNDPHPPDACRLLFAFADEVQK